ncbi:hypothetical protein CDV57_09591 [Aspergillus fumigatus]|nr:hypothetical protein CDV57_09591 [Aspergillus fumigatus]
MIVRANVPGSGSGWRGAHSVWGGPCVGPRAHTKWASQNGPPASQIRTRERLHARSWPGRGRWFYVEGESRVTSGGVRALRRPLESRNHGWDGRLPPFLKRGPTEGTCAPPVTERRPAWQGRSGRRRARTPPENHRPRPGHDRACKRSRVRIWLAGGPFCMGWSVRWPARPYKVGLSGSPVAWAARGLGHSRRAGRPSKPAPACPPVPSARAAHRSLRQGARARPISAAGSVCLSVYRDGWIGSSLAG